MHLLPPRTRSRRDILRAELLIEATLEGGNFLGRVLVDVRFNFLEWVRGCSAWLVLFTRTIELAWSFAGNEYRLTLAS